MMPGFHDYIARRGAPGLADAAIALRVPVFPCDADKKPLTRHGFKDASADPAIIRRMFADPAATMIGMPTGEASGVVVVDVDVKDGAQGAAWLDANTARMVQTRTVKTRSGGLHLCFLWPGEKVRNSASKIAPGIDVRGDGGYVIVPPSPGYAIADDAPLAPIPDWLLSALLPAVEPAQPAPPATPAPRTSHHGGTAYGLAALDEECHAIRTAGQGAKHATLNKAAFSIGGLVTAGELEQGTAYAGLSAALGDIRHLCKDYPAALKTLRNAFSDGMGRPRHVPDRVPEPVEEHPAAPFLAKLAARAKAPVAPPVLPVAPALLDVPGALRLFVEHCDATAISPQPFLALAAGITMLGALAGRRYRTTTDLRTNLYAIGIADSGAGKDHARKQIKRALFAAGLERYLGGSDVASGSALRTALLRHPAMLFQIDEFGDWLGDVLGEKASTHRRQIAAMLKELYSSANLPWQGIEYADQSKAGRPREDIHQPHACLYGTSTPGQFWNAVAGASMHDGLMARLLIFVSPCSYPDEREPGIGDPAPELLAALQAIADGVPDHGGNLAGVMMAGAEPQPYTVPETPEATSARRAMRQDQLAQQRKAEGTYVTAIAGRLAENAMKLALLRAVCRTPAAPVIDAGDVAWGRALAQHCIDTLLREAKHHVADSDYERRVNRMMEVIRKHGPCTEREIIRRFRLGERDRAELLRTLVTAGMIVATASTPGAKGGRPTTIYSLAGDDE